MKIRFFSSPQPQVRKNGLRISLITHDLGSAYTLPPPQNQPLYYAGVPGGGQEVKTP
jgi:hypothetical protein